MIDYEEPLSTPIRNLKLVNGDQIVAYINSESSADTIILEHPCQLNLYKEKDSTLTYYFTKYMPLSKYGIIRLNSSNIVAYTDISEEVEEKYIRAALSSFESTSNSITEEDEEDSFDDLEYKSFSVH